MKLYVIVPTVLQMVAWPITHLIFRINGKFVVHGRENLKKIKGPFVMASNHRNELDPVVQRATLSILTPLFWVARKRDEYAWSGWRKFVYGDWFFKSWGAWPAYKGHGDYEKSLRHHINILKDGNSVGVFPQGTMGVREGLNDEEMKELPARGGVCFLAHHTKTPILPVTITGLSGMNFHKLFFGKKKVDVYIHSPIFLSEDKVDYRKEAQKVMKVINSIY